MGKPINQLVPLIQRLTEHQLPFLYWMGYGPTLYLVSASHITNWTVLVSANPVTRVFPRRWLDITGTRITDIWDAALKAVIGTIVFRPGIPQIELRWRLRAVYDRQEMNDILRYLHEDGALSMRYVGRESGVDISRVLEMDEKEEKEVYWFIGRTKRWYHGV